MKFLTLLLPVLFFILAGCQDNNVFVPTYENPDIVGSGKSTKIKIEPKRKHGLLGKHGCVPKSKLVLDSNNYFFDFTAQIGSETFYYIAYRTVSVHKQDGSTKSFSPAYYRSRNSELSIWNGCIDSNGPFRTDKDGVGLCSLTNDDLKDDGNGRWFFEDKALIFDRIVCPNGKNCLRN